MQWTPPQRNISRQNALNARVAKRRNRDKANYRERKKRARMDDVMGTLPEQERRLFRQGSHAGEFTCNGGTLYNVTGKNWRGGCGLKEMYHPRASAMLQTVRQVLNKDQWNEFLKALELFTEDILSRSELVVLVADLFMDNR